MVRSSPCPWQKKRTDDGAARSRSLAGGVPLTDFNFKFSLPQSDEVAGIDLEFKVVASSAPSTNIHALIGRNGVGKTTLLNEMVSAIIRPEATAAQFLTSSIFSTEPIQSGYFSSLVSVAFSAFDPFAPPQENADPGLGTRYSYIGLKDVEDADGTLLKTVGELRYECLTSLRECFSDRAKSQRWRDAIATLEGAHFRNGSRVGSKRRAKHRSNAGRLSPSPLVSYSPSSRCFAAQ